MTTEEVVENETKEEDVDAAIKRAKLIGKIKTVAAWATLGVVVAVIIVGVVACVGAIKQTNDGELTTESQEEIQE